jgi:hypothetical protein
MIGNPKRGGAGIDQKGGRYVKKFIEVDGSCDDCVFLKPDEQCVMDESINICHGGKRYIFNPDWKQASQRVRELLIYRRAKSLTGLIAKLADELAEEEKEDR